ncbi:MAG: efflux RND transporter periplasmic adaptor subunit [Proteobacteria bacterium]|nr:efflux RND transporter periplasmic adaptor subunit [Pseudomonadota bacterium]
MSNTLFRTEAANSRLQRHLGPININLPLSYKLIGFVVAIFLIGLILFLIFAKTAEKIIVRGYLDNEDGIISIHSELGGLVVKQLHKEGDKIKKGELLMVISQADLSQSNKQINNLNQQINNFKQQYLIKTERFASLVKIHKKKYLSDSQLKDAEADILELDSKIKNIELEQMRLKQGRFHLIKAPKEGVITNVLFKQGQFITPMMPLLQILPQHTKLIVNLPVPVQHVSFLKNDADIFIQYDAYPYQRFGVYKASIKKINLTVLTDEKEDKPIKIGQPYYKIKAELKEPFVWIYGKKVGLTQGMTVSAVLSGDKQSLWQWILDPVYSYYGRHFS